MFYNFLHKYTHYLIFSAVLIVFLYTIATTTSTNSEIEARTIELERAKAIAIEVIGQNENTPETVTLIFFPEPVRKLLPNILLISLPHNSDPLSWSRVAVDNCGQAYVIERLGSYSPQWEENLSNILWSQGLSGTDSINIAQAAVAVTFITHSQPGLISWTTIEEVKTPDEFTKMVEDVVVENLEDNTYITTVNLVGTQDAKTTLIYRFNQVGKLIDIEEEYDGPYFE